MDSSPLLAGCFLWSVLVLLFHSQQRPSSSQRLDNTAVWAFMFIPLFFLILNGKARRSSQSVLKEINPEYSLEGLMLKLKFQYFGHLMGTADSLEKGPWCWERLKAGGEEGDRGWDCWMASRTQWTWVWANSRRWWRTGKPDVLQSMGLQRVGNDWKTEQQPLFKKILRSRHMTHGTSVPWPGIKPTSLVLEPQSLNYWTTREVPICTPLC